MKVRKKMIEVFVKRPATTIILILFFVLLGFVSYFNLNVEQNPKIDFPLVSVNVIYPGASPEDIEVQIIKKVEDSVVEIADIKNIKSRAFENFGYVLVEFNLGADVNVKSSEVKDKVDSIINDLPKGIDKPVVARVDPFATSVVELALVSKTVSPKDLFEYADKKLKNEFSKVKGVGSVDVFGGRKREIRIELDPDLMEERYITITDVIGAVARRNLNVPIGSIDREKTSLSLRYVGEFSSVDEIRKLRLNTVDGSEFLLSEIAKIYDGAKDAEYASRFNGENAVTLSIKKISDGNEVKVSEGIQSLLPKLRKKIPKGVKLKLANEKASFIQKETFDTIKSIGIGVLLTIFIIFLFSGDFRMTIIAAVVIPSSIVSAFLLMDFSGFSINFITLLAMATALGTLIANAIVIIESVMVHLKQGKSSQEAAIDGTKEVLVPVLASCGTNLVVFTPIAFMGGIVGQFMLQFGLTVVYATLFSLLASFSLTPMMCGLLLKPINKEESKGYLLKIVDSFIQFLLSEYKIFFNFMFKIPIIWSILVIASLMGAFSLAPYLGNEFIPVSDENRIQINLTLPQGSTIEETERTAKEIESLVKTYPEVESTLSVLGENGKENGRIVLKLKDKKERAQSDVDIIESLTPAVAQLPNAEIEFVRGDGGGGMQADVSINLSGPDYNKVVDYSKKAEKILRESGYFRSLVSSYKSPKDEIQLKPDLDKLERYGVSGSQLGMTLRSAVYGDDSNIYKEGGEEYDIRIELDSNYKRDQNALSHVSVMTRSGLIPVTEIGTLERTKAIPNIWRRDRKRIIQLNGYLSKSTAGVVQAQLTEKFNKELNLEGGYSYAFVGNAESQQESSQEIGKAFGLAILLTFMLLVAILNSFVHPLTISSSIITSFGGVFLFLFFAESSINIASMLGIVMLVGLVVNSAILFVDEVENILKSGEDEILSAIWKGMENKFRAILMTSIAIMAGALPQIWSPNLAKASMGLVIIGGTAASIVYTFIFTPIVYWYIERLRRFVSRKAL